MSTEQVVEFNSKSTRLIEKLTKALKKVSDRFGNSGQIPSALTGATSSAASLGAASGNGTPAASAFSQFSGFQDTMSQMIIPMIQSFAESSQRAFELIVQKILAMSQAFTLFTGESIRQMGVFSERIMIALKALKAKKDTTGKLGKVWKGLTGIIDKFSSGIKVATFLMGAHEVVMAAYNLITGTATFATKRFIVQNKILNAVLRKNPIIFLVSVIAGAAAAFLSFSSDVSTSNDELQKQNDLLRERIALREDGHSIKEYATNLKLLDNRQLKNLNSRLEGYINTLKDNNLDDLVGLNKKLKPFGITSELLPSPGEIASRFNTQELVKTDRAVSPNGMSYLAISPTGYDFTSKELESLFTGSEAPELTNAQKKSALFNRLDQKELLELHDISKGRRDSMKSIDEFTKLMKRLGTEMKTRGIDDPINETDNLQLQDGATSIAAGGKKMTHITINLEKMVENIAVNSAQLDEGLEEIETMVKEVFLRVLNSGNYAAQ